MLLTRWKCCTKSRRTQRGHTTDKKNETQETQLMQLLPLLSLCQEKSKILQNFQKFLVSI